ncbi:hypothetical protein GCM10023075_50630 [Streptosporangium album]
MSRQGYYAWKNRGPSRRARQDEALTETIIKIHAGSRGTYGSPRVHAELREEYGVRIGRKRVARLMRAARLEGVHRRRRRGLTRWDPAATPADDLVQRDFTAWDQASRRAPAQAPGRHRADGGVAVGPQPDQGGAPSCPVTVELPDGQIITARLQRRWQDQHGGWWYESELVLRSSKAVDELAA